MNTKFTIELESDEHEEFLNARHCNFPISYKHNFMTDMPKGFLMLTKISISTEIPVTERDSTLVKSINMNELLRSSITIERDRYDTGISFGTIFYDCLLQNKKCKLSDNTLVLKPKLCINDALAVINNRDGISFGYEPQPCVSIAMCLPMLLSIKMTFVIKDILKRSNVPISSVVAPLNIKLEHVINALFIIFSYFDDEKTKVNDVTYTINEQHRYECDNIIQKKFGDYVVCIASVQTTHLLEDVIDIITMEDVYKSMNSLCQHSIKTCILSNVYVNMYPLDSIKYVNIVMLRNTI